MTGFSQVQRTMFANGYRNGSTAAPPQFEHSITGMLFAPDPLPAPAPLRLRRSVDANGVEEFLASTAAAGADAAAVAAARTTPDDGAPPLDCCCCCTVRGTVDLLAAAGVEKLGACPDALIPMPLWCAVVLSGHSRGVTGEAALGCDSTGPDIVAAITGEACITCGRNVVACGGGGGGGGRRFPNGEEDEEEDGDEIDGGERSADDEDDEGEETSSGSPPPVPSPS